MEHLVSNLKEKLILRRKNEYDRAEKLNKETCKDLLLISTGKIIELDFMIKAIDELMNYFNNTKKLVK